MRLINCSTGITGITHKNTSVNLASSFNVGSLYKICNESDTNVGLKVLK